jgi:hypothetical protein
VGHRVVHAAGQGQARGQRELYDGTAAPSCAGAGAEFVAGDLLAEVTEASQVQASPVEREVLQFEVRRVALKELAHGVLAHVAK